ncbi:hypothetical protein CMV_027890 [Castanea mollissima]|uniref:Pinin/SDK/MemA protein domain-containing protein n=1 Tax=Castanea mollissima TaxID=60419 RepID=A0A8J4Q5Z1_9ROSI|nr:hypothetical protein CMV_027890 [Castanea mollissima]
MWIVVMKHFDQWMVLASLQGFRTKAEPPIYYLPKKPLEEDETVVQQRKEQKLNVLKRELMVYTWHLSCSLNLHQYIIYSALGREDHLRQEAQDALAI